MLRKLSMFTLTLVVCSLTSLAQTIGDFKKIEVFAGYSNNQVDTGIFNEDNNLEDFLDDREGFNGFNFSVTGNLNRYVGIKGDVAGHYKNIEFVVPPFGTPSIANRYELKSSIYNFLGGVQAKDNATGGSRLRPFGHAMVGLARGEQKVKDSEDIVCIQVVGAFCPSSLNQTDYGVSGVIGGGLDIKATDRIAIRAFQFDYNPTRLYTETQHNVRIGFGIVF
jgi:hypothetical protein